MPHRPDPETVACDGSAPEVLSHQVNVAVEQSSYAHINGPSSYPSAPTWGSYASAADKDYNTKLRDQIVSPMKREVALNGESRGDGKRMRTEPRGAGGLRHDSPIQSIALECKPAAETPSPVREVQSVTSESSNGSHMNSSHLIRGREPIKKRKKFLDVLRRNRCKLPIQKREDGEDAVNLSCEVSPVSSGSAPRNHSVSSPVFSPPSDRPPVVQPSRTDLSYDSKEAQTLSESAKICNTADITPSQGVGLQQHQVVRSFPEVLYSVLANSESNGSVVQWLDHGRAWRVVRWDALRRQVMPKFFPQLCQEEGERTNGGSIDAFLFNVRAWGFHEIKDSPDAGAYSHQLFVRGNPTSWKDMQLVSVTSGDEATAAISGSARRPSEEPSSPHNSQSFLRVPSLAMSRSDGSGENRRPDSPPKHQHHWRYYPNGEHVRPTNQYHEMYHPYGWHYPPVNMYPQHHEDPSMGGHHHYQHHSYPRHGVVCPSPYDSRYPFRPHPETNLAPPSIRSGRGGARIAQSQPTCYHETVPTRATFPVSQRGKGRGSRAACRTPIPSSSYPGDACSHVIVESRVSPQTYSHPLNSNKPVPLTSRSASSEVNSK